MKDSSSSSLVIVVLLVTLLGGSIAFYVLKQRWDAEEHVQFSGEAFTVVSADLDSDEWKEWLQKGGEKYSLTFAATAVDKVSNQYSLRADLIDSTGKLRFSEEFPGGWGLEVLSPQKSKRTEGGPGLVELGYGNGVATQYYRVIEGRLVLVRLEDAQGRLIRNSSARPIGPKIPERSPEAWEASLSSSDPGDVLWALSAVRGDSFQKRIAELTSSPNPWIVEAAKAAAGK